MKTLVLSIIVLTCCAVNAQNFEWAKNMSIAEMGSGAGFSIASDTEGNVYTTGQFSGTVDFDPGVGTFLLTSAGIMDIFISKLDADGNFVWAKSIGGTESDYSYAIAVDADGNVYTTGRFEDTVDFNPGTSTFNLTSAGNMDIFISKLDAEGNFVWAKSMGGTSNDDGRSIAVDAYGNVYTTGRFSGTVDFDPGTDIFTLSSTGTEAIFISKLDAEGNFVWAKSMGGTALDSGYSIAIDADGNVYTTGQFSDTADFDPGEGTFLLNSAGNSDIFISKLDTDGNFIWAKSIGGTGPDRGSSLAFEASGKVYITGGFNGTVDFDPGLDTFNLTSAGSRDIFICKLDTDGNLIWAKNMGGEFDDYSHSLAVDAAGNVYTTGGFASTADFDPGPGTYNLTPVGMLDIFVSKLDAEGNFSWAISIAGTNEKNGISWNIGEAIAIDLSGNVYTTGIFNYTADFDSGPDSFLLTTGGIIWEVFVLKLSDTVTSNFETNQSSSLSIYPNPSPGLFTVAPGLEGLSNYSIYDTLGKLVLRGTHSAQRFTIDLSHLPVGLYVINLNGQSRKLQKLD